MGDVIQIWLYLKACSRCRFCETVPCKDGEILFCDYYQTLFEHERKNLTRNACGPIGKRFQLRKEKKR